MPIDYDAYHEHGRTRDFGDVYERSRVRQIAAIMRRFPHFVSSASLLDIGSGEGRYLPVWRRLLPHTRIVAMEYSALASSRASTRYPFAQHVVGSAEDVPVRSGSHDAVVSIE